MVLDRFARVGARTLPGLLAAGLLAACVAPPSYEGGADNVSIADTQRRTMTVDPKGAWQDSDLFLPAGTKVRITAKGKWSPWPLAGLWSGADGNEAWRGEVSFIPGGALMGRLGKSGKPFFIGSEADISTKENGRLYLAMNDPFSALWDNAGEMKVTISARFPAAAPVPATGQ